MPANRLSRLLHRGDELPQAVAIALHKLGRLGEQQPELHALVATNAALLRAMYARELPIPAVAVEPEHAALKHEAGLPLLRGEPVIFDDRALRDQLMRLCDAVKDQGNPSAAAIAGAVKNRHFVPADLAVDILSGNPAAASARADELGLDADLAATLLRLTLFPVMTQLATDLKPLLDTTTWRRGYCPVCGAWPLLGEYRGLELTRFLRCGLCAAEWEIDRLVCPICDNRLHQDLTYLGVEGEEQSQRAVACERCHCYVKQISTLQAIPAPELIVADLQSLHLDLVALQRNFVPPQ